MINKKKPTAGIAQNPANDKKAPSHQVEPRAPALRLRDKAKKAISLKPEFAAPAPTQRQLGASRREFLQVMGAGAALASVSCMKRPAEKLVPYIHRPKDIIPGEANYYASSYYSGGEGFSIVVKTREGRPIKIEGNEKAERLNGRGLSPRSQASVLSLYDPQRLRGPRQNLFNDQKTNKETVSADYKKLDALLPIEFKKGQTALLTNRIPSPSFQKLAQAFKKTFSAQHYVWDPISFEALSASQKLCYGQALAPSYDLEKAEFIFALNCDFLGTWLAPTECQRRFALGRKSDKAMSRLVVLESLMSLTGANADERHRIEPQDQLTAMMALAQALWKKGAFSAPAHLQSVFKSYETAIGGLKIPSAQWAEWAGELFRLKGRGLILFGDMRSQSQDSEQALILSHFLNSALGNDGQTINHALHYPYEFGSYRNMSRLISDLNEGRVKRLIIHGLNPVYAYAQSQDFLQALKKAETVIYTGDRMDETAAHAHYVIPDGHSLEKWSDWEFKKGVFSVQQPAIRPLGQNRAFEDSLIQWIKGAGSDLKNENFYEMIKSEWTQRGGAALSWESFLKIGVSESAKARAPSRSFKLKALELLKPHRQSTSAGRYFLSLYESASMRHGDMSNNAWLMEFPDPVSKICWENYISVSPRTALKEGLKEGQVMALITNGGAVSAPAHIQPGQADHVLGLAVGWGRESAGSVGSHRGVNAYPLAGAQKGPVFFTKPALFKKTNQFIPLANVQGHHQMEGRDIILETTWEEFQRDPASGLPHSHKAPGLWSKHDYKGHKWGMVIDLNSCNGCGACITACQSENNIPTVGKKYVLQGREMHWIRVDRYYKGDLSHPETLHQPVVCMHCDNAPCETVCPVLATVHSKEGTNDMVYNRCVGTRYCSNNCPYKVRRFNWFDYTKKSAKEPLNLALNPDVTVRHRGVMEKCSFCIQRIQEGKAFAKKQGRKPQDGEIQTACQQSCPSQAISFGDLNDPQSKVHQAFRAKNSYALLDDMLNTKPAVRYRTKIRNKKAPAFSERGGH